MPTLHFAVQADYDKVIRLKNEITKLETELKKLGKDASRDAVKDLEDKLTAARAKMSKLVETAALAGDQIERSFGGVGKAIAGIFAADKLREFVSEMVRVRGEFQQADTAIRTLLGSEERANALMAQVRAFAKISPLEFSDVTSAAQMMLGFNIEAEKVATYIKALGDVSMGNSERFKSLTLAFSQMSAAGKLMGQDLNQMINAGFNPLQQIAEQTGKTMGELREEMAQGVISAEMVQQAFIDATSEGGRFFKMSEEGAKTINGQISMLQDAIATAFNEMGTASEGAIMAGIKGATALVQNYEKIGIALTEIVAIYGTYKAAVIAAEAISRFEATARYTQESAALLKLLTVEQQAVIAKKGLSASSAEYNALIKAEIASNIQNAQAKLATARTEVSAANQVLVARRAEYVAAKNLEKQRLAELMHIGATGSAKQVELATTRLSTAEKNREAAAMAYQNASREFYAKQTAVVTAAKAAETTTTAANTAAETANATSTNLLTAAKTKLLSVTKKLVSATLLNPWAILAASVVTMGVAVYKYATALDATERAQKRFNERINEAKEAQTKLYEDTQKNVNIAADEYESTERRGKAMNELIQKYPEIIKKYIDENGLLRDKAELLKEINELEEVKVRDNTQQELESTEKRIKELEKLGEATYTSLAQGSAMAITSIRTGGRSEKQDDELEELIEYRKKLTDEITKDNVDDYLNRLGGLSSDKLKEVIEEHQKNVRKFINGVEKVESKAVGDMISKTQTESIIAKAEGILDARNKPKQKDPKELEKERKEAERLKAEFAQRAKLRKELTQKEIEDDAANNLALEQARIDNLEDGYEKEKAQINLNYDRLIQQNKQREQEMVEAIKDKMALDWVDQNPTSTKTEQMAYRDSLTDVSVSDKQMKTLMGFTAAADAYKVKAEQNLLDKLLKKYQDYSDKRAEIEEKFTRDTETIAKSDLSGDIKQKAMDELHKQRTKELQNITDEEAEAAMKSSSLFVDLFTDAAKKSDEEIRKTIKSTEDLLEYLKNTDSADIQAGFGFSKEQLQSLKASPEQIESVTKALEKLQETTRKKNPFKDLADAWKKLGDKDAKPAEKMAEIGKATAGVADEIQKVTDGLSEMFAAAGNQALADAFAGVSKAMSAVSNIGKGFAEGGLFGGISAAVGEAIGFVTQAFQANARHKEALKEIMQETIAYQRAYNLALMEQNLLYEQADTIFGKDTYGKAKNAVGALKDATAELQEQLAGLGDIEIKTGHKKTGLFGWGSGKDIYSSILDVYPELIDAAGNFNRTQAEAILNSREFKEEDAAALQHLIDLYDQMEEASQALRDHLTDLFGDLGGNITDALVDAFQNGTDAASAMVDSVEKMLENLAKQMVYSAYIAPIMAEASEAMEEIANNEELTDEERFNQYMSIITGAMDDAIDSQKAVNATLSKLQDEAEKQGIDLFQKESQQQQASRGYSTSMSEDTGAEISGRVTAINENLVQANIRLSEIDGNVVGVRSIAEGIHSVLASSYLELQGINENTSAVVRPIKQMAADISDIKRKTANL